MQKIIGAMICSLAVMAATDSGRAGTITINNQIVDVRIVDTLRKGTLLLNSNPTTEASWVNEVLYPESVQYTFKIDKLTGTEWYDVYDINQVVK
ncbi:hypothetical protein [Desulfopila aestuarii]|uniref:Uncharacterized protein n=1 Tax=Desulfopila aestuarii DSM 18488 TaxID=1121416 RepID=A0A1M7YLR2_9BACT|nr:hypothetical protein [Desulfopila aestuarii]SHO53547.1 hypothetical protein SAMN02745220_05196 [Desulfopila aestuarii DSM 18488]